jgi:hypothetical protein
LHITIVNYDRKTFIVQATGKVGLFEVVGEWQVDKMFQRLSSGQKSLATLIPRHRIDGSRSSTPTDPSPLCQNKPEIS